MIEASTLGLAGAAAAGLVSFLSPCVLPLVPAYVSVVMGVAMVTGKLTELSYWLLERFPVLGQIG